MIQTLAGVDLFQGERSLKCWQHQVLEVGGSNLFQIFIWAAKSKEDTVKLGRAFKRQPPLPGGRGRLGWE